MPQFRFTHKFAIDYKISSLPIPNNISHPLDDWLIDRMIADRKKIAVIIHVKTLFTFFIPYADAGGAKKIIPYFKEQLKMLFEKHNLLSLSLEVETLFTKNLSFTKTVDKKLLGYLNDFKRCSEPYPAEPLPIDWEKVAENINDIPVTYGTFGSSYPLNNFNALLSVNLPKKE